MAQMMEAPVQGKSKKSPHKVPSIDMTPMVDLGFLLITFFIFTTTMTDPTVTKLVVPKESPIQTEIAASRTLTALLGSHDQVYVYSGRWEDAVKENRVQRTSYDVRNGLGSLIRRKQAEMGAAREKMVFLIKPHQESSYRNLVDGLDEVAINNLQYYALVEPTEEEKRFVER